MSEWKGGRPFVNSAIAPGVPIRAEVPAGQLDEHDLRPPADFGVAVVEKVDELRNGFAVAEDAERARGRPAAATVHAAGTKGDVADGGQGIGRVHGGEGADGLVKALLLRPIERIQ